MHLGREWMHAEDMTTTVTLDPDVYFATAAYAGAKGITLSAAISELVRRSELVPVSNSCSGRLQRNEYGFLEIAKTGHVLTPDMVKAASEDELA